MLVAYFLGCTCFACIKLDCSADLLTCSAPYYATYEVLQVMVVVILQVEKYMDCLPKNCIPFKGSKVEQQRKHLLYYQHPPHDTNVEYCHQMPELEKKRMKKFVERCSNSFGIGKVSGLASDTKVIVCCHSLNHGHIAKFYRFTNVMGVLTLYLQIQL